MPAVNQATLIAYQAMNGFAPRQKPKGLAVPLDFTATGSNGADILIDLESIETESKLEFVQTVFFDNTLSGVNFKLIAQVSGQTLTIAAGLQAYLPIVCPKGAKFIASTTFGGVPQIAAGMIMLQMLNMPMPIGVW